jgi:WD40 repeat protein
VRAACFTPDGAFLATAGDDHVVTLWEAPTGRKVRTFGVPRNEIRAICVASRGNRFAVGHEAGNIEVWDTRREECVRTIQGIPGLRSLSISPDGTRLVCSGEEPYAKLLDREGRACELRPWVGRVTCVAWSTKDNLLALGGRDEESAQVGLYDLRKDAFTPLRPPRPSNKGRQGADELAFSSDGRFLAGTLDGSPVLWTLDDLRPRSLPKVDWTCGLAFSPDGRLLAGGTTGYEIVLWDVETLRIKDILRARRDTPSALTFSPDGQRLAIMTAYDPDVEVRDISTGARLALLRKHAGSGRAIAFLPGGRLVSGGADGRLIFWRSKQRPDSAGY